jgi:hypothetical protein
MSTAPAVDEREHSAALIEAISAALTAIRPDLGEFVYDLGSVPGQDQNKGTVPDLYVALQIERRFVPNPRLVQVPSRSSWRVATICVARTVDNARLAVLAVTNALDGQRLTVGGVTSTPIYLETSSPIIPDDGMFSAQPTWAYSC